MCESSESFPAASAAPRIPSQPPALSRSEDANSIRGQAQKHSSQRRTINTKANRASPAVATAHMTSCKSVIMSPEANLNEIITHWNMQLGINQDSPFFPRHCHVLLFFFLLSTFYPFSLHSSFFLFKMCSLKAECFEHVSLRFAFLILPFVRYTKLLRWLGTLKREGNCNFLNNPLAGTSGPDDTRHMTRAINYGISDSSRLEATCIEPALLQDCMRAAILLQGLLGMLFRLNAFLCVFGLALLAGVQQRMCVHS